MPRTAPRAVAGALLAAGIATIGCATPEPRPTAPPPADAFPFVIPADDALKSATDVSALNPAPLTADHKLTIRNGHFFDKTGRRVRFVGVNIASGDPFPEKKDAPKIAARLRKFGVNLVRLHHMDATWAKPSIFRMTGGYEKTTALDPKSLDRLDFFVAQLAKHGIYVDLNLHVSREWNPADGFPAADGKPALGKVIAYFDARAITLQKQYATQLLTHVNPYLKQRWADLPGLALIELNNEDSLVGTGDGGLPPVFRAELATGWNAFLKTRYGTTAALRSAWNRDATPLGENLLANGRFQSGTQSWVAESQGPTALRLETVDVSGQTNAPDGKALKVTGIRTDGTNWHLQLHQIDLTLKPGQQYTVSFVARADAPRPLIVSARLHQPPWSMVGTETTLGLDTRWKRYTVSFVANQSAVDGHNRLSFTLGDSATDFYLADLSLRPGGGDVALAADQTIEAGTIELPGPSASPPGRDYVAYLMDVEERYTRALRDHIRGLGCSVPVACSQASYGGIAGVWREANLDWVDMHSYWQHPSFPAAAFDPNNFRIDNTPMVKDGGAGTLDGLAMHRVAGKPFTVSEYDHPAPSEWAAEMIPMLFAYAAWQDWDGVFLFDYEPGGRNEIQGYFDVGMHPAKWAFLPYAANLFLRGDLGSAVDQMLLTVPSGQVAALKAAGTDYSFWGTAGQPVGARDFVTHRASVRFDDAATKPELLRRSERRMPLGRLSWDHEASVFIVDAPAAKSVVGLASGKTTTLTNLSLTLRATARNFAAIALTAKDGKPIDRSGSLLLTAVDTVNNRGLDWNAERTFAQNAWKSGPTIATVPSGTVTLTTAARSATVWALDGNGRRRRTLPSRLQNGSLSFEIGPSWQTLWYEIATQ
jgi:hypothetical protein